VLAVAFFGEEVESGASLDQRDLTASAQAVKVSREGPRRLKCYVFRGFRRFFGFLAKGGEGGNLG